MKSTREKKKRLQRSRTGAKAPIKSTNNLANSKKKHRNDFIILKKYVKMEKRKKSKTNAYNSQQWVVPYL